MLKQISEAFNSGNYNASLSLLLEEVEPEGDVNTLIDSMRELSRFSTEFATSNESRSRNVQKAAGLLNCVILEPGEELSYNELLGPRTEELGWLPAHGISGGKEYIDTPGGGICQVSSTLYNSLLLIGPDIRIVSRSHHSIPGSYVAMGLDATVSYYGPDLVWSNAAESPMFLLPMRTCGQKQFTPLFTARSPTTARITNLVGYHRKARPSRTQTHCRTALADRIFENGHFAPLRLRR